MATDIKRLFICYSRKDAVWRDRVASFFTDQPGIHLFTDEQIGPGEDWDGRIRAELEKADGAVVLVSQDLLNTKYVADIEMPRLIQRAESGRFLLMPLFVRASNADTHQFQVAVGASSEVGITLTKYQGALGPKELLASYGDGEWEGAVKAAVDEIKEAVLAEPPSARPLGAGNTLNIELRADGGKLTCRYVAASGQVLGTFQDSQAGDVATLRAGHQTRRLFSALFGGRDNWQPLLQKVLGEPLTAPVATAVRVRLQFDASASAWRNIPWALATWANEGVRGGNVPEFALVDYGWTFEHAQEARMHRSVRLAAPTTMLVAGMAPESSHGKALANLMANIWERRDVVHFAPDAAQLASEMERRNPKLVYLVGEVTDAGLRLAEGDEPLPLDELSLLCRRADLVLLNTWGDDGALCTAPESPAWVHLRAAIAGGANHTVAVGYLRRVFAEERLDPVTAFARDSERTRRSGYVAAGFAEWQVEAASGINRKRRAREALDRIDARAAVLKEINEVKDAQGRNVLCLVAYGRAGNLVEYFPHQVLDTLLDQDFARFEERSMGAKALASSASAQGIEDEFREWAQLDEGQDLSQALGSGVHGDAPVPLFDWGTFNESNALSSDAFQHWLQFCGYLGNRIRQQSPARMAICYLGLEGEAERWQPIIDEDALFDLDLMLRDEDYAAKLVVLPALDTVTRRHILEFLDNPANSTCPSNLCGDVTKQIFEHCGGEFAATVELLERLENEAGWYDVSAVAARMNAGEG